MKLDKKNKIALVLLMLLLSFIIIFKIYSIELLDVRPFYKIHGFLIIICILSLVISTLIILIVEKMHDFFTVFNFMWAFPLSVFFCYFFVRPYDIEKIDYIFSNKITEFQVHRYKEGGWEVNKFVIENDTIYLSQNPSWEDIYNGKFLINKSIFQNHYHLTKAE